MIGILNFIFEIFSKVLQRKLLQMRVNESKAQWRQIFFIKWTNPGLFYCLFSIFSDKHHYNFYNKYMLKCPSSKWCRDSNPQPSNMSPNP